MRPMRRNPTDFWLMALRAFKRLHGYEADRASVAHQKFLAGWQQGYRAAMRKRRADNG